MEKTDSEAVYRALEKISASLGKSDVQRKLLHFLTERALRADPPKELDIAIDVFGKDASFNSAEDATVRVNVRTLRQKLEEYYRGPGRTDPLRLEIPKGGYRLTVAQQAPSHDVPINSPDVPIAAPDAGPARSGFGSLKWAWVAMLAALTLSLLANAWLATTRIPATPPAPSGLRDSFVWGPILSSSRPLTIVLGDLLLFGSRDPHSGRVSLVRDPLINTSEQLRAYLAKHPDAAAFMQGQTTLVPKSGVYGLSSILPLVSDGKRRVNVVILDELQLTDLRDNDIIYIGPLVRLGPLAEHFFRASRYRYDSDNLRITDSVTHKTFGFEAVEDRVTDQGLFATFPGPSQNRFMIFTSAARDVGVQQVIRTMTSPDALVPIRHRLIRESQTVPLAFEVLMNVSGYKRTDLNAEMIDAHALSPPIGKQ
jgi:hypothetical protein